MPITPSSTKGRATWRGSELGAAGAGQRAIRALGAEPAWVGACLGPGPHPLLWVLAIRVGVPAESLTSE